MSTPISDSCHQQLGEQAAMETEWKAYWIFLRERFKRYTPDALPELDKIEPGPLEGWEAGGVPDVVLKAEQEVLHTGGPDFVSFDDLAHALIQHVPGWDNATCSMDWQAYACYCAWLAQYDTIKLKAILARQAAGQTPWEDAGSPCPASAKQDPKYGQVAQEKVNWDRWIAVGGLVVATIGLVWMSSKR